MKLNRKEVVVLFEAHRKSIDLGKRRHYPSTTEERIENIIYREAYAEISAQTKKEGGKIVNKRRVTTLFKEMMRNPIKIKAAKETIKGQNNLRLTEILIAQSKR